MRQGTDLQLPTEVKGIFTGSFQLHWEVEFHLLAVGERIVPYGFQIFCAGHCLQRFTALKGPGADLCDPALQVYPLQQIAVIAQSFRHRRYF